MAKYRVFISYKHEQPWVAMAEKFRLKLSNNGPAMEMDYFIDSRQIDVGSTWRQSVDDALARCTHLLCLLSDTYWDSTECRRELDALLTRRAMGEPVRPCFVLAEAMKPAYLRFNADNSPVGDVRAVGDFQFLGPYDESQRRVPLDSLPPGRWGAEIEKMLTRLQHGLA